MKTINIKSLVIGVLLASTIFLGVAAVAPKDTVNGGLRVGDVLNPLKIEIKHSGSISK